MLQTEGSVERILTRRSSLLILVRSRLAAALLLLSLLIPSGVQAACTAPRYSYLIVSSHITRQQYCPNREEAQAVCNTFIADLNNGNGGMCFTGSLGNGLVEANAGHYRYNGTGPFYWLSITFPLDPPLNDVPDNDSNLGSPSCSDGCFGDPVNAGTGNKFEHQTDYVGQGSLPLTIRWTYNSRDGSKYLPDTAFIFGRKRTYAYSESVKLIPYPGKPWAYVTRADGKSIGFQGIGVDWVPKAGEKTRLYAQYSGTTITSWLFEDEEGDKYLFNASGRLLEVSNAMGGRNTLTYNAQGKIDKVVDQSGRALRYEYNASGLVSKILLPDGGDLQYFYSSEKDLIRTQFPGGVSRQYLYNEAGLVVSGTAPGALTGVIDESSSRYSSTSYDAKTKALTTKLANGLDPYAASYQMKTHQLYVGQASVTFPAGKVRNTSFTAINGRVLPSSVNTTCAGCPSQSTTYTYDVNGHEDIVTKNGISTDFNYDSRGQLMQRIDASNDNAGNKRTVQIDWHPNFNAPTERRIYDAAGVLVKREVWTYNSRGQVVTHSVHEL